MIYGVCWGCQRRPFVAAGGGPLAPPEAALLGHQKRPQNNEISIFLIMQSTSYFPSFQLLSLGEGEWARSKKQKARSKIES